MTPDNLYILLLQNKLDEFYYHLDNDFNINDTDIHGNNLFSILARDNKFDIIKQIEKYNPNYDCKKTNGNTPLIVVSGRGFINIVEFLINKNVRLNETNNYNDTALLMSSKEGHLEIFKMLLNAGADPTIINNGKANVITNSYGDVKRWLSTYDAQKYLLYKFPTLYQSFDNMKFLLDEIKEEFKYIVSGSDLNLF